MTRSDEKGGQGGRSRARSTKRSARGEERSQKVKDEEGEEKEEEGVNDIRLHLSKSKTSWLS